MSAVVVYLYGVVRAEDDVPDAKGLGEPATPLRGIVAGDVAAVAGDLPDDFELRDEDAVRHLDVLNDLAAAQPVLPLQFGTVAPDDESVRTEVLAAPGLRESLEAIGPYVELRIEFVFDEDTVVRQVLAADPALHDEARATSLEARIELGQAVSERVQDRVGERGRQLVDELTELTADTAHLRARDAHEDRWALLVERSQLPEVDGAVLQLREGAPDASITYVGPMPPVSFLDQVQQQPQQNRSRWGW